MNPYSRAISEVANAIVALCRWVMRVREVGHEAWEPTVVFSYEVAKPMSAFDAAYPKAQAYVVPVPQFHTTAVELEAPVSLRKQVNLVRPFVHLAGEVSPAWERAVGRAQVVVSKVVDTARHLVPALDELGLPSAPMATIDTLTVGVFEQTLQAFKLRTGNRYAITA